MKVASPFRPAAGVLLTLGFLTILSSKATAFFFPPITVPPRTVHDPGIPVTPHFPPPSGPPQHSPPPVDTAPEPATLISSAVGAGLLGLYSLRRRRRKS